MPRNRKLVAVHQIVSDEVIEPGQGFTSADHESLVARGAAIYEADEKPESGEDDKEPEQEEGK